MRGGLADCPVCCKEIDRAKTVGGSNEAAALLAGLEALGAPVAGEEVERPQSALTLRIHVRAPLHCIRPGVAVGAVPKEGGHRGAG